MCFYCGIFFLKNPLNIIYIYTVFGAGYSPVFFLRFAIEPFFFDRKIVVDWALLSITVLDFQIVFGNTVLKQTSFGGYHGI